MCSSSASAQNAELRILLLNQNWFAQELRSRGHEVTVASYSPDADIHLDGPGLSIGAILGRFPPERRPNRLVYYDDSYPLSILGLESIDIPTLFYSIDTHHHLSWHKFFARIFDAVWVAHLDFYEEMHRENPNTEWVPLWAPVVLKPNYPKTIEVCFRGNLDPKYHPIRAEFLKKIGDKLPLDAKRGAYIADYPNAKIVVNQAVKKDLNFRVFEAMSAGAMLLTPQVSGLDLLFRNGEHLVLYEDGNVEDVCATLSYYLKHENERERIAQAGHKTVIKLHTPLIRAMRLEKRLREIEMSSRKGAKLGIALAYLHAAIVARNRSVILSDTMFQLCVNSLFATAHFEEQLNSEAEGSILMLKHHLETKNMGELSLALTKRFADVYPDNALLLAIHANSLMKANCPEQCQEILDSLSSMPTQFIGDYGHSIIQQIDKTQKMLYENALKSFEH